MSGKLHIKGLKLTSATDFEQFSITKINNGSETKLFPDLIFNF